MNINKQLRISFKENMENNFEFWTEKKGSKRAAMFRLRNAAIEKVVSNWIGSYPSKLFYPEPIEDIATSEDRAIHYGVSVGAVVNTYYLARDDYNSRLAEFKARVRSEALGMI